MTAKMCNTMNQNIESLDTKLVEHIKSFGTLLSSNGHPVGRNDVTKLKTQTSSTAAAAAATHQTHNSDNMQSTNAVWDRGKVKQDVKQVESSLETYLEALPVVAAESHNNTNILNAYKLNFDNLSSNDEMDIESLSNERVNGFSNDSRNELSSAITLGNKNNTNSSNNNEPNAAQIIRDGGAVETASLSNFHNIQYIEYIHLKLEQYLKTCKPSSSQLEAKIGELKRELESYVEMINQRKEIELRRFSENMSNSSKIVQMRNAFMKKEMNGGSAENYDNVSFGHTDAVSYYSNDSICDYERCKSRNFDGFFIKNCYDRCSLAQTTTFDTNSIEYYSMLITEEKNDNLVNDAAPLPPPRYNNEREKISLIYRNPCDDRVIEQWQKYQLNTITIKKPKKNKMVKIKMTKEKKNRAYDIWSFTLDYHKTRMLQMKLEKERKIRLICRTFFYFFGLVCFILVVIIVQSVFNVRKK